MSTMTHAEHIATAIADRLVTVYGPGGPAIAIAPVLRDGSIAGEYAHFEIVQAIVPIIVAHLAKEPA